MILRRRNSIATSVVAPCHLTLPTNPHPLSVSLPAAASSSTTTTTSSSSSLDTDFDSRPISSYTSLKYLISGGAVHSPTAATPPGSEISIRNRLVKQAAWAYLRPMSTSSASAADRSPLFSLLCCAARAVARAFNWVLRHFRQCFQ